MRKVIAGLWLLLVVTMCLAQNEKKSDKPSKPDLSGTWVLDESKSSVSSGKEKITGYTLIIVHREPEIRMTKKYKQGSREFVDEVVYYTDGKPEYSSLKGYRDPEPVIRWRGRKLVRRSISGPKIRTNPPLEIVTTEEWELSEDGRTLTRIISSIGPGMSRFRSKYVFDRIR